MRCRTFFVRIPLSAPSAEGNVRLAALIREFVGAAKKKLRPALKNKMGSFSPQTKLNFSFISPKATHIFRLFERINITIILRPPGRPPPRAGRLITR